MSRSIERQNTRMKQWDYSDAGWYFVTICVKNRDYVFGDVKEGKMILNYLGKLAKKCWQNIPKHFPNIEMDEFIIMPNHVHGIVVIHNDCLCRGRRSATPNEKTDRSKMKLSKTIHGFKSSVTRKINKTSAEHFAWQRSFHDYIIRNEKDLQRIQRYIYFNACKWKEDDFL